MFPSDGAPPGDEIAVPFLSQLEPLFEGYASPPFQTFWTQEPPVSLFDGTETPFSPDLASLSDLTEHPFLDEPSHKGAMEEEIEELPCDLVDTISPSPQSLVDFPMCEQQQHQKPSTLSCPQHTNSKNQNRTLSQNTHQQSFPVCPSISEGYEDENVPNQSFSMREERDICVESSPARMDDIVVEFNKGPETDNYGATKYCSRQDCLRGEELRWGKTGTFQAGVKFRRGSTNQYLLPTQVIINGNIALALGENGVVPSSIPKATELKFEVYFEDAGVSLKKVFSLSLKSKEERKPDDGLLSFAKNSLISHHPSFLLFKADRRQHPEAMSQVALGLYFTLHFDAKHSKTTYHLSISQPSLSSSLPPPREKFTKIALYLIARPRNNEDQSSVSVKTLRKERRDWFLGGRRVVETKREKGRGGEGRRKWLNQPEQRDLIAFKRELKKRYPERYAEVKRSLKGLEEEMKREGGAHMSEKKLRCGFYLE